MQAGPSHLPESSAIVLPPNPPSSTWRTMASRSLLRRMPRLQPVRYLSSEAASKGPTKVPRYDPETFASLDPVEEWMPDADVEEHLRSAHKPGILSNDKWARYGGHRRAQTFAAYHGVIPGLLDDFRPRIQVNTQLKAPPQEREGMEAR